MIFLKVLYAEEREECKGDNSIPKDFLKLLADEKGRKKRKGI
jgi:hypothetical protein